MLKNLIIRPVEMKDAVQFNDNLYVRNTLAEVKTLIEEDIHEASGNKLRHIVAELDGEVVGTAILVRNAHALRSHRAEIAGLVVKYELWGKGIARQLVEACKTLAINMGIEILEVGCRSGEPAEEIYKRLGFIEFSRLPKGLKESWGERMVFDEVILYQPIH